MSLCPLETNQDEQGDKPGTPELLAVRWLLEKSYGSSSRGAELLYPRQNVSQQLWHRHRETEGRRGESAVSVTCQGTFNKGRGVTLVHSSKVSFTMVRKTWLQEL